MEMHPKTIQKILNDMSKEELIVMIEYFEHYPTITKDDDIDFILAYLDDESCSISKVEIVEYLFNSNELNDWQEQVLYEALYYEFIQGNQFKTAKTIIQKYTNDFNLLESEVDENSIGFKLALASQI